MHEASPIDLLASEEFNLELDAGLMRDSYLRFGQQAFPHVHGSEYVHGRHFDVLVRHLEAVARRDDPVGHISRLIINMPPAVGKSYWTSQIFVPWIWTWWPEARVLYFSYSAPKGTKDSVLSRDLLRSKWYQTYFPDLEIKKDDDTKGYYANTRGGWRQVSYPGGEATGAHPDIIVIDDPIKADDARSLAVREFVKHWYFETLSTRGIGRGCAHIVNHQRLHVDDLSGAIEKHRKKLALAGDPDPWHAVVLPMRYDAEIAMPDRGYGGDWRKVPGVDLVYPELLPEPVVRETERSLSALGPWAVDSQLGQKPTRADGQFFKTSKIVELEEDLIPLQFDRLIRFWDLAGTEGAGCWTVGALVGRVGNKFYLLDIVRDRLNGDDVELLMKNTCKLDAMVWGGRVETYFEREPGSSGKRVAQIIENNLRAWNVLSVSPSADKVTRAGPLATLIRDGYFYLVLGKFAPAFLQEAETFPAGEKDQIDGVSGAIMEHLNPENRSKGNLVVSGSSGDSAVKYGEIGKCQAEGCKRPAFLGNGYCCTCCERGEHDAMGRAKHESVCNSRYDAWFATR